jgi:DtxR family Mn-dependent transcriptional regulator
VLEHVISEKLEERIAAALNYPTFDPHGDPIPTLEGQMTALDTLPLSAAPPGGRVRVARVLSDNNSDLLRYLAELGLVPGAAVRLVEVAPFDGPVTLQVLSDGEPVTRVIGRNLSELIRVEQLAGDGPES